MKISTAMLYRILFGIIVTILLVALCSCATGSNDGGRASDTLRPALAQGAVTHPLRLVLGGSEARDSAAIITPFFVDQAIRQTIDSIPSAAYVTINFRDSLADAAVAEGKKGIPIGELAKRLNVDGVIFTRAARFSNVLAVELRIIDPASGRAIFRDISFSMIRYRDTTGTMFLGPALYDAVRKSLYKYFGVAHSEEMPVATEPLVVAGLVIAKDPKLGRIAMERQDMASEGVKALGEYARINVPELVALDYESRREIFRTVNVVAVEDYAPMAGLERRALFNIGIDRFLTGTVTPLPGDQVGLRLELRSITSANTDSLVDHADTVLATLAFQTSTARRDFVVIWIDMAEKLYPREADRLRNEYAAELERRAKSGKK
ncbi:MAG: hypothetical protein ABIR47_07945 [Candidatus Kapaibacterium sp.]